MHPDDSHRLIAQLREALDRLIALHAAELDQLRARHAAVVDALTKDVPRRSRPPRPTTGEPMNGRAPEAIRKLWNDVEAAIPRAKLSGILGDAAHFAGGGYHVPRRSCPSSDYSVTRPRDRKGASDCASALDITLPPDLMVKLTRRLLNAAKENDPRLYALREFCGTLNGDDTYPWDLATNSSEGVGSWDDSHLWHIHLSFWRDSADNYAALAPIADVLAGRDFVSVPAPKEFTVTPEDAKKIEAIIDARIPVIAAKVWDYQITREKIRWSAGGWLTSAYTEATWIRQAFDKVKKKLGL